MVSQKKHICILIGLMASLSGCGQISDTFKRLWNAEAPPRKTVTLTGDRLPPFLTVFEKNDQLAVEALEKWRKNITDSLKKIKGEKKDFLRPQELDILVKSRFINLADDPDLSLDRSHSILRLLGFKDGIPYGEIDILFDWIKFHRVDIRSFYNRFITNNLSPDDHWTSRDLAMLIELFGSFLERAGEDQIKDTELLGMIHPWLPEGYPHAKAAMKSGLDLGIAFFSSFCGDRVDSEYWNGKRVGICLRQLLEEFKPTEPLFDFFFGALNPALERQELAFAAAMIKPKVENWLHGHHHPNFPTLLVADFAKDLDIPAPYYFFKLMEWLPQLNSQSTERELSPTLFIDVAQIFQDWVVHFIRVTDKSPCLQKDWKSCAFTGRFEPVDQLYNGKYATLVRTKNYDFVNKIAFYDSISSFLLRSLDTNHDGYLSKNTVNLITVAIRLLDTNAFAVNVIQQLLEKPTEISNTEESTKGVNRNGLAGLAALAADLIPQGEDSPEQPRSFLKKMEQGLFLHRQEALSYDVNQLGITTFLYIYDLIGELRDEYLAHYDMPVMINGTRHLVQRRKIMESMPRMLHDHFPRLYNECLEWGFERTCGVLFTEILSEPSAGTDTLETYEMDVITLTSILVESMMNHCDQDGDGILSNHIFKGTDEKHCIINLSDATVRRLMDSNIVKENAKTKKYLNLANDVSIVRWAAKKALTRGSIKKIWSHLLPPLSLVSAPASLGSLLSLASEFMAMDKIQAIDGNTDGPPGKPGDEIIYHHQLTDSFLPSRDPVDDGGNSATVESENEDSDE